MEKTFMERKDYFLHRMLKHMKKLKRKIKYLSKMISKFQAWLRNCKNNCLVLGIQIIFIFIFIYVYIYFIFNHTFFQKNFILHLFFFNSLFYIFFWLIFIFSFMGGQVSDVEAEFQDIQKSLNVCHQKKSKKNHN